MGCFDNRNRSRECPLHKSERLKSPAVCFAELRLVAGFQSQSGRFPASTDWTGTWPASTDGQAWRRSQRPSVLPPNSRCLLASAQSRAAVEWRARWRHAPNRGLGDSSSALLPSRVHRDGSRGRSGKNAGKRRGTIHREYKCWDC